MRHSVRVLFLSTAALLLGACGSSPSAPALPEPDASVTTGHLSGSVSGWGTQGAGVIEIQERPEATFNDPTTFVTLSQGTVSAAGTFDIDLPGAEAVAPYLHQFQQGPRSGCSGQFTQSAPSAHIYTVSEYGVKQADGTALGYTFESNPEYGSTFKLGDFVVWRMYSDQADQVTGTLDCPDEKITLRLNLKPGWNAVIYKPTALNPDGSALSYTISTPATLPRTVF